MRAPVSSVSIARLVAGAAVALAFGFGCGRASSHHDGDRAPPVVGGDAGMDQVLAHVGDETITLGDFAAVLAHMDEFDRVRYRAPERRKQLLAEMIDVTLLAQEARERGYDRDPATEEDVNAILRDAVLKQAREGAPGPNDIPPGEVRAYYDAHRADFHDPERRRVSAIVLSQEGAAESALRAAEGASPERWGQLVRARSVDPGAKGAAPLELAGDLGFVAPPGDARGANARVPEPVRAAVFEAAQVGDVVPHVVAAGGAFYVVKFAAKSDAHDRSFEDAERSIRVKLAQDKAHAREEALLEDLRKQYPVAIDEAALATVRVEGDDAGAPGRTDAAP